MKQLNSFSLRLPQIRVLRELLVVDGGLSKGQLSERIGNKTAVVVGRAIGYSDPDKRAVFEETKDGGGAPGAPCPSLLTMGFVEEINVDIDGSIETIYVLTDSGREKAEEVSKISLPPLRD